MVEKKTKRVEKKVENRGVTTRKLTNSEEEVYYLISKEFLTVKQIAIRRGVSDKAIYKTLSKLKKKGVFDSSFSPVEKKVEKIQPTIQPFNHSIRLHAQEFRIKILFKDYRYVKLLNKSNTIFIDNNQVRLFKDSIEVYSGKDFYADDVRKATVKSFQYWHKFMARLEHDFKIIIIKPKSQNIKLVNQHYAEINNELSEECEKKGYKIRVYTTDDGKLWFTLDNSFNLKEAETLHPQTAQHDMEDIVKPFFNDLRDNPGIPLMSQTSELIQKTQMQINQTNQQIQQVLQAQLNTNSQLQGLMNLMGQPKEKNDCNDNVKTMERADYIQ